MRPTPLHPSTDETTLVLLDPSEPSGESALDQLTPDDAHVTLVVLLWDHAAAPLRRFADEERVSVAEAGSMYLAQVASRLDRPADSIAFEVVGGTDARLELAMLERSRPTRRVLRPASTPAATERRSPLRERIAARFGASTPSLLTNSSLATRVPASELATLDTLGTIRRLPAAARIISQGAEASSACVVVDGRLSIEKEGEPVAEIGPGEFAGELSLLTGARCNADVIAAGDAEVLVLDQDAFAQVLEECPAIASHMLKTSVRRLAA